MMYVVLQANPERPDLEKPKLDRVEACFSLSIGFLFLEEFSIQGIFGRLKEFCVCLLQHELIELRPRGALE